MKALNIGCGTRFHPAWTNIDANYISSHVQVHDVKEGLPFPDESFDVVYHSHLLEHLPRDTALPFSQECYRILKRGGIIRVAVPDLERIARLYLRALENALCGDPAAGDDYSWMMLELYDQAVRDKPGGAMCEYLKQNPMPNEKFVHDRLGEEARQIIARMKEKGTERQHASVSISHRCATRVYVLQNRLREAVLRRLLGRCDYQALVAGRFRSSGEVHKWMYDRYSLALLLEQCGFKNPVTRAGFDSAIENWLQYRLDGDQNGTVYKPDSLYIEAIKPAS